MVLKAEVVEKLEKRKTCYTCNPKIIALIKLKFSWIAIFSFENNMQYRHKIEFSVTSELIFTVYVHFGLG